MQQRIHNTSIPQPPLLPSSLIFQATTTSSTKMSEPLSPTEDLSSLTAPDWPSTYTTQALAWFRELRFKISSIIHRLTKTLEAALQVYQETNSQEHPRYRDLQGVIDVFQDWLQDDFIGKTLLTKDYLTSVWMFLGACVDMGIWDMATPRGASAVVLEEMKGLRKEVREIASEARNVARMAQDVAVSLEEYKEGHVVEMFPGFD